MVKRIMLFAIRVSLFLAVAIILVLGIPRMITWRFSLSRLYSADTVPPNRVAIVFGAGLQRAGVPSIILRDRISSAAELYFSGKVEKLLMSGDNSFVDYNEPGAMRAYALTLGVPDKDIVLDYAGRRTYDTCYRASKIFGVTQAILITQNFHMPRALYLCNMLGVKATGVVSDKRPYWLGWSIRELPATLVALWEVHFSHPMPVLGNPEPIFPPGISS
jgi:SanA protein